MLPEQVLPGHAEGCPSFDLCRGDVWPDRPDQRAGVVLGLQQAMDHHCLIRENPVGRDLQPDQGNSERVAVGLPPPFRRASLVCSTSSSRRSSSTP
jgi:hypothetical protein